MVDRLRALLDRPLDPLAARAVVVLASAILLGFAVVFVLGVAEPERLPSSPAETATPEPDRPSSLIAPPEPSAPPRQALPHRRQDPQDERGSGAARRAAKALRSHRALQHVPYRRGHLNIRLVGARGSRAMLAVGAPTLSAARRDWRRFLRRYRDDGRAYLPRFRAEGGLNG